MFKEAVKPQLLLAIVILVGLGLAACTNASSSNAQSGDNSVAATVNGRPISLKEVDTSLNQQAKGQQAQMSQLELAAARMQVLDDLTKQEVLFQRAEREKLLPSEDDITQAISQQKTANNLTEDQYQKALKDSGQTEQSVREMARKQLAVQRLLDREFGKIKVSDKEVEDYYNGNREQFVVTRGVELGAIVVDPADNGLVNDAKGDPEAKLKVDNLYQRLINHADFAEVARQASEDQQSGLRGGNIGFYSEDQLKQQGLPQDLIAKFFTTMQPGDITAPVHLNDGRYVIFKLISKHLQNENLTLDSPGVREQITEALRNQRKQILQAALIEVALNEAKVVNNLAANMLNSPNNLSGLRPAPPQQPSPQAGASPAANAPSPTPGAAGANTAPPRPAATLRPAAPARPASPAGAGVTRPQGTPKP